MTTGDPALPNRRRPRDRREQIEHAAAVLFNAHGYHAVRLEHVAAEVGVTPSALYRHFPSKQALLTKAVLSGVSRVANIVDSAAKADLPPDQALATLVGELATAAVDHQGSAALWKREAREMRTADRDVIRGLLRRMVDQLADMLRAARPELATGDAELLSRAVFAVSTSLSQWQPALPAERITSMLRNMASAVARTTVPAQPDVDATADGRFPDYERRAHLIWFASRREALLGAAADLFLHRGFASVSMEDLGEAAGVAAPNIYRYFPGKADILTTLLMRTTSLLATDSTRAVRLADKPADILPLLLGSYARSTLEHTELVALTLSESAHLPGAHADAFTDAHEEYLTQWTQAITEHHPKLTTTQTRVITLAAMTVINDASRVHQLRHRPNLANDLVEICLQLAHAGARQ